LLIFDEVITGFRLAPGGAAETTGVNPDLAVYAKAMAGGFSLSAVAGRADILDQMEHGVVHSGTYNGNPIVLAAANAVLDIIAGPNVHSTMIARAESLVAGFRRALGAHGIVGSVHNVGPVVQLALGVAEVTTLEQYLEADWEQYNELSAELVRRGQFVMPGGRWFLSTEHSVEQIDKTIAAFDAAVATLSPK
jgi:glutamate-1-semialdehyde 2,1-aminomutase